MGQEVSSPLFCLDAGKQDSPQNKYAKKVGPKKPKPFTLQRQGKENEEKNISKWPLS